MADYTSVESSQKNYRQPLSSIFTSPGLFTSFVSKGSLETESLSSPTSIMDSKPFCVLKNPFKSETNSPKQECKNHWDKLERRGVSLGLVDALIDENSQRNVLGHDSRMVLLGSQLRIHVPPLPPSPTDSPCDFGIKTRHSHVGSPSPSPSPSPSTNMRRSPFGSRGSSSLSATEMELSEDYTCVISYGPNPRTTHIFDDCIVESCCGVVNFSHSRKENGFFSMNHSMSYPSESFLSFCYTCKKNLGQGKDIYMYRGEKAFCSSECRCKEMMLEEEEGEGSDTSDSDHNMYATSS